MFYEACYRVRVRDTLDLERPTMPRPKAVIVRKNKFNVNLSDEERQLLTAVAQVSGFSDSDYIRQAIRNEAKRLKIVLPAKPVEEEEEHAADEGPSGVREVSLAAMQKELMAKKVAK